MLQRPQSEGDTVWRGKEVQRTECKNREVKKRSPAKKESVKEERKSKSKGKKTAGPKEKKPEAIAKKTAETVRGKDHRWVVPKKRGRVNGGGTANHGVEGAPLQSSERGTIFDWGSCQVLSPQCLSKGKSTAEEE